MNCSNGNSCVFTLKFTFRPSSDQMEKGPLKSIIGHFHLKRQPIEMKIMIQPETKTPRRLRAGPSVLINKSSSTAVTRVPSPTNSNFLQADLFYSVPIGLVIHGNVCKHRYYGLNDVS